MSPFFTPHMEILPSTQRELWPHLRPTATLGLVLYGGTAIALQLGHRESVDFDFFTDKPLDKIALQAAFPFIAQSIILQDQPNTFTLLVPCEKIANQHVKISFFGGISFGRIGEPKITSDGVLQVATLDDLMATKVKVILQRIEVKDYKDIAAMLKSGIDLTKGLAAAHTMYGHAFQPSESLKAMVYFEGGDLNTITQEEKEILINAASKVRKLPDIKTISNELALLVK